MNKFLFLAALLLLPLQTMAQTPPAAVKAIKQSFYDDFTKGFSWSADGSTGTWMTTYPYGAPSSKAARTLPANNEAECYSDSTVGVMPFTQPNLPTYAWLSMTANTSTSSANPCGLPYTSALMTTYKSFSQLYGYFEIRAKLPNGSGLWPAFWMLPSSNHYTAELDIFEFIEQNPTQLVFTTHGEIDGKTKAIDTQKITVDNSTTSYHTYGADWEPTTITLYVDGVQVATAPTPASMDTPMYLLVNLAVGGAGSWPGAPTASTKFPASMSVAWVAAYTTAGTIP